MLLIFDRRGSRWGEFRDVAWGESSGETATRAGGEGATRENVFLLVICQDDSFRRRQAARARASPIADTGRPAQK